MTDEGLRATIPKANRSVSVVAVDDLTCGTVVAQQRRTWIQFDLTQRASEVRRTDTLVYPTFTYTTTFTTVHARVHHTISSFTALSCKARVAATLWKAITADNA